MSTLIVHAMIHVAGDDDSEEGARNCNALATRIRRNVENVVSGSPNEGAVLLECDSYRAIVMKSD